MAEDRLDRVLQVLGNLEEGQENAVASRKVIHERLDRFSETMTQVRDTLKDTNFALRVTTDIATSTRDQFKAFKEKFDEEAAPVLEGVSTFQIESSPIIEDIKKARRAIVLLIWILGACGLLGGGTLVFANDFAKGIIRDWLEIETPSGIPPIN